MRLFALTHVLLRNNEALAREGIDTSVMSNTIEHCFYRNNEALAREGIDTMQTFCLS